MITNYAIKKGIKENASALPFHLSPDEKTIISNDTNEYVCSIETYSECLRRKAHCNFVSIYYEHISGTSVLRCEDCGCVIIANENSEAYNSLVCPVCSGKSLTAFDWYSKEEIDTDPEKRNDVEMYLEATEFMKERDERYRKRGNLYDFEVTHKKRLTFKKSKYTFQITASDWIEKKCIFAKSLFLEINKFVKDEDGSFVIGKNLGWVIKIPLTISALKIRIKVRNHIKNKERV